LTNRPGGQRRLLILFLVSAGLLMARLTPAAAASNRIYIDPASATVAADGSTTVDLVGDPGDSGLAAWVLDVAFDPGVVTTSNSQCDPVDTPAGATGVEGCEAADTNSDGVNDTVKTFGGIIFNGSGKGLSQSTVLAVMEFSAASGAAAGACSPLTIKVTAFSDADGNETNPSVENGQMCLPGPGRTPGLERTLPANSPEASGRAGGTHTGTASPVGNGPSGETPAGQTPSRATASGSGGPGSATHPASATGGSDDSGGPSAALWVLLGLGGAALASGAGWAAWRARHANR
jgi:hypothetical protein